MIWCKFVPHNLPFFLKWINCIKLLCYFYEELIWYIYPHLFDFVFAVTGSIWRQRWRFLIIQSKSVKIRHFSYRFLNAKYRAQLWTGKIFCHLLLLDIYISNEIFCFFKHALSAFWKKNCLQASRSLLRMRKWREMDNIMMSYF